MPSLQTYWTRAKGGAAYYGQGFFSELTEKNVFLWAQAIAFKVLVTIVPVLILATGIFGRVLLYDKPFEVVSGFLRSFLPAYQINRLVDDFLRPLQSASGTLTLIGVLGLILSAMTLFTTLRLVISGAFQEDWHKERSILGGYVFDLRMAAQVGLVFLLTLGLTLMMSTINAAGFEFIQSVGLDYVWLQDGWRRLFKTVGLVVPFALTIVMFFQLYYFIPKPHPPHQSALLGAVSAAVIWEGAKGAFTFYAANVGRFDRYSTPDDVGLAALGDTFGLIIAFVFWVYFSGLILALGALLVLLHEKRHRAKTTNDREAADKDHDGVVDFQREPNRDVEAVPSEASSA